MFNTMDRSPDSAARECAWKTGLRIGWRGSQALMKFICIALFSKLINADLVLSQPGITLSWVLRIIGISSWVAFPYSYLAHSLYVGFNIHGYLKP